MKTVKEACVVDMAEGGSVDRLHTLLLAMTGRVDDDAVNSAREMLGIGQLAAAAELLTGCLLAGRIPVTPGEQSELRRVLDEARSQRALADRLHVVEVLPTDDHRFSEQNRPDSDIAEALQPVAQRLTGVRALWCAWRSTPAGVTYGAVPRRVLLAEVGSEGSVTAVGYQLLEALRRAGLGCSVDVFNTSTDLPDYHRKALSVARRVHVDIAAVSYQNGHSRAPRASSGGESASSGSDLPARPPAPQQEPEVTALAVPEQSAEFPVPVSPSPAESTNKIDKAAAAESPEDPESKNMRVPAAVDAKLTDRERNLLRKLHEELAQREQDRGGSGHQKDADSGSSGRGGRQDSWNTMPGSGGTGGFPPIGAAPNGQQNYDQQP